MDAKNKSFIGKQATVIDAKNTTYRGVSGLVIDETKSSLIISTTKGRLRILKSGTTFTIGGNRIEGNTILKRPEERAKS